PQGPVEDAEDDQRDRTTSRRISPTREDTRLAARRRGGRCPALRLGRERPSQVAQNRRLEENRRCVHAAHRGGGLTVTRAPVALRHDPPGHRSTVGVETDMKLTAPAKLRAQKTYNAAADLFDARPLGFWARYGERTVARLHLKRGATVLDVACGTGASALPAA